MSDTELSLVSTNHALNTVPQYMHDRESLAITRTNDGSVPRTIRVLPGHSGIGGMVDDVRDEAVVIFYLKLRNNLVVSHSKGIHACFYDIVSIVYLYITYCYSRVIRHRAGRGGDQ